MIPPLTYHTRVHVLRDCLSRGRKARQRIPCNCVADEPPRQGNQRKTVLARLRFEDDHPVVVLQRVLRENIRFAKLF